jgi:site-specific DNA-methyltransferase (adenine-specific)/adenine-specific DNA-methyltransferase
MAHLLREFRGQIRLIYIDPPFDSGADYRKRIKLRGTSVETDLGVLEERQYTDIWSNDLYLQYMYERLILMRELLAEDGSIYLHTDWHKSHLLRCLMDEIFGNGGEDGNAPGYKGELVWCYKTRQFSKHYWNRKHQCILFYTRGDKWTFNWEMVLNEYSQATIKKYKYEDEKGKYRLSGRGITDSPIRSAKDVDPRWEIEHPEWVVRDYLKGGYPPEDWMVIDIENQASFDRKNYDYPTMKPKELIRRIIRASSNEGDIVADFFIGSGTTAAVAQRLGRRWIGADINLGAIHTTAQRLGRITEEQQTSAAQPELFGAAENGTRTTQYATFEVYNVNHYEVFKNAEEARDIVLKLYGVEPLKGHRFFDGTLDSRWVKVVDLNRICSKLDIQTIFDNLSPDDTHGVVVLCAGHEYDVPEAVKRRNLLNIPFEVRDILTDRKDVIFKRPPEAKVGLTRQDGRLMLTIEQFYSPLLLQKLSLEDSPEAIEDWRQTVASVLIDPAYDGQVFHPRLTDTPARQDTLVRGTYAWDVAEYGDGPVAVKIVDVLDEEWFGVLHAE